MKSWSRICGPLAAAALFAAPGAGAAEPAPVTPGLPSDPVLDGLVAGALEARPELGRAKALAAAAGEQVPQVGALPDPVLTLGIQNDGFGRLMIGEMETSYYQIMVSQGLPWPGKRRLRTEVARAGAEQADTQVARVRLTTEAEVRRAYLDLLLVRDRLALLDRLETTWQQSAGIARARYEAGEGAQSDVLRSQLELNRLKQRRAGLQADERNLVQTLNRLRAHPLDEPIETPRHVRDLGVPAPAALDAVLADALARSPELAAARLGVERAGKAVELARRERYPDFTVGAGVMPRGDLEPMWQATVGFNVPVFSGRKQGKAVAENEARAKADRFDAASVEQVLRLRVAERRAALAGLLDTVRIYDDGLLVQSRATAESTLAQYGVGRVTFASVLEANAGYLADEDGYLQALADAHRLQIAAAELSLDPVAAGGAGLGATAMPGAGSAGAMNSSAPSGGAAPAAAAAATPSMSRM
jgi:outer membrane protein TolC